MRKIFIVSFLLLSVFVYGQETFVHEKGNIQITLPAGWSYQMEDEGGMTVYSPDESLGIVLYLLESSDIEKVMEETVNGFLKDYPDLDFQDPVDETINGMPVVILDGVADKGTMSIGFALVVTNNGKILMFTAISAIEISKKYDKEFENIIASLKPIEN